MLVPNLFAYIGIGPGMEFMPSLLGLIGIMASALFAVLQWPLFAFLRCFRFRATQQECVEAGES